VTLGRVLVAVRWVLPALVPACTAGPAGSGVDAPRAAQAASGTVLAMNVHEAIICLAVGASTADVRGGCYDLRTRTDVRRGDEVGISIDEDTSNDGNKRDEVVAIDVLHAA
jgi:hypothetical protein